MSIVENDFFFIPNREHENELTETEEKNIELWYSQLKTQPNRQVYLAASLIVQLAIRPSTIKILKSENFVKSNNDEYMHITYLSKKKRNVDWPIIPELWNLIQEVAGCRLDEGKRLFDKPTSVLNKLTHSLCLSCGFLDGKVALEKLWCFAIVKLLGQPKGLDLAVNMTGEPPSYFDTHFPWTNGRFVRRAE